MPAEVKITNEGIPPSSLPSKENPEVTPTQTSQRSPAEMVRDTAITAGAVEPVETTDRDQMVRDISRVVGWRGYGPQAHRVTLSRPFTVDGITHYWQRGGITSERRHTLRLVYSTPAGAQVVRWVHLTDKRVMGTATFQFRETRDIAARMTAAMMAGVPKADIITTCLDGRMVRLGSPHSS